MCGGGGSWPQFHGDSRYLELSCFEEPRKWISLFMLLSLGFPKKASRPSKKEEKTAGNAANQKAGGTGHLAAAQIPVLTGAAHVLREDVAAVAAEALHRGCGDGSLGGWENKSPAF